MKHQILFGFLAFTSVITGGFCIGTFIAFGSDMDRTIFYQFSHESSEPLWMAYFRPAGIAVLKGLPVRIWTKTSHTHYVSIAPWWPFLVCAAYPLLVVIRKAFRGGRREGRGECLTCGYSLTGNTSGVCPECGTRIRPGLARFLIELGLRRTTVVLSASIGTALVSYYAICVAVWLSTANRCGPWYQPLGFAPAWRVVLLTALPLATAIVLWRWRTKHRMVSDGPR